MGDFMLSPAEQHSSGKAFVCAIAASDLQPRLFRTYHVRENPSANCRIWEAARATSAAPTFFKRISIGEKGHAMEDFIDAAVGYNNPTNLVLEEAKSIFGSARPIRCVVSIGTGHPGTVGLSRPDRFQKILPTKLIQILKQTATECEHTASLLNQRFRDFEDFYYRFSVEHGAEGVSLEEWDKMGDVQGYTKTYLSKVSVSKAVDKAVQKLCHSGPCEQTLGSTLGEQSRPTLKTRVRPQPVPSSIFTGRVETLNKLKDFFPTQPRDCEPRRECLLYGMGGAGKTQIALQFARECRDRFDVVLWVDATDRLTVEQSYKTIAVSQNLPDTDGRDLIARALHWLSRSNQNWLLLFDNCESTGITESLLPEGDRGNILYTGRNPALGLAVQESISVVEFEYEDAVTLLLKAAKKDTNDESMRKNARPLVELLGCLPLAIDIAGASIYMGRHCLDDYVQTFQKHRGVMMKDPTFKGSSKYNQAVYAVWDISHDALHVATKNQRDERDAAAAQSAMHVLGLLAFFHNEAIMEEIFRRAAESRALANHRRCWTKVDNGRDLLQLFAVDKAGNWDNALFRAGIARLLSFSLIKQDQSGHYFSMHTLVHSWARDRIPASVEDTQWDAAVSVLASSITSRFLTEDLAFRRQLLPHIRACTRNIFEGSTDDESEHEDASKFALVYHESGHWKEAEELEVQVMEMSKRVLGQEHPSTLTSQANLASTYWDQGRHGEALDIMRPCVAASLRRLGEEHPDVQSRAATLEAWEEELQEREDELEDNTG